MKLYRAIIENMFDQEDLLSSRINLIYDEFEVIRETTNFYIIKVNGKERKVGKESKAQFAAATKEKSLIDAWHRNRIYRSILKAKVEYAKKVNNFIKEQLQ